MDMKILYPYIIRPPDNLDLAHCPKCKKDHPISNFYAHSIRSDGYIRFRPICKNCRRVQVKKNKSRPIHTEILKNNMQICKICNVTKPLTDFYCNGCFDDGVKKYRSRCKECIKTNLSIDYYKTKKTKAEVRSASVKNYLSASWLKTSDRKKIFDYNLDIHFLLQLYENQKGLCAISGIKMTHLAGQGKVPENISIDRIDPTKGYIKENVHLVCLFINIMKLNYNLSYFLDTCKKITEHNKL